MKNKMTLVKVVGAGVVFVLAALLFFRGGEGTPALEPEVQQAVEQANQQSRNEPLPAAAAAEPESRSFSPSARPTQAGTP